MFFCPPHAKGCARVAFTTFLYFMSLGKSLGANSNMLLMKGCLRHPIDDSGVF